MTNPLLQRADGILDSLNANYQAGKPLSTPSVGFERELIVNDLLKRSLPPMFRFGSGEIVDQDQNTSKQIDIVVENPNYFSLPITEASPRLYMADGVCAAIEVKSTLGSGSGSRENLSKHRASVASLKKYQQYQKKLANAAFKEQIPYFVVAMTSNIDTRQLAIDLKIDGILVIDKKSFYSGSWYASDGNPHENPTDYLALTNAPESLVAFLETIRTTIVIQNSGNTTAFAYLKNT